jgi:uncharacterized protein
MTLPDSDIAETLHITTHPDLSDISADEWDALAPGHVTVSHAYLQALTASGSATRQTGWQPHFLIARRAQDGPLVGAVPLYLKSHSYGEYVFDWAWAEAHERHGVAYYPKWLVAVPFTPVEGPRLLARDDPMRELLARALLELAGQSKRSSLHILYPHADDSRILRAVGMSERTGIQFHWNRQGERTFEDLLARMNHDKRKRIRQERRKVAQAGVTFDHFVGDTISSDHWDFFYRCYTQTYREHHSTPYLTRDFFTRLARSMGEAILLVVGHREGSPICVSLSLLARDTPIATVFGRYWGCLERHDGLHFETCYYQPLEFAINHGFDAFEGGAQGEHKLARGLTATKTSSFHWLRHPAFAAAIDDYLARESAGVAAYEQDLSERSPFVRTVEKAQ